jgi:hypothetical protein
MTLECEDWPKTSLRIHQNLRYSLEYVKYRFVFILSTDQVKKFNTAVNVRVTMNTISELRYRSLDRYQVTGWIVWSSNPGRVI